MRAQEIPFPDHSPSTWGHLSRFTSQQRLSSPIPSPVPPAQQLVPRGPPCPPPPHAPGAEPGDVGDGGRFGGCPSRVPPAHRRSLSPTQGCRWLRAAAASTPASSTSCGPAPTCLHRPTLRWTPAPFLCRLLPWGAPGFLRPGQPLGPLRAAHTTGHPAEIRAQWWPQPPCCSQCPSPVTRTSWGSRHRTPLPARPPPWGHSRAGTSPQAATSPPAPLLDPQSLGDLADDVEVSEEELLREALRPFGSSSDTLGVSQEGPGSVPLPWDPASTGREGGAVAPAPLEKPASIPGYLDVEGQPADTTTAGTATPAGASPRSDVPPSPSPAPQNQHPGDPADHLEVSKEELLQEAQRLFRSSSDSLGLSRDGASSVSVPGDPAGTGTAIPPAPSPRCRCPRTCSAPTPAPSALAGSTGVPGGD